MTPYRHNLAVMFNAIVNLQVHCTVPNVVHLGQLVQAASESIHDVLGPRAVLAGDLFVQPRSIKHDVDDGNADRLTQQLTFDAIYILPQDLHVDQRHDDGV